MKTFVLLLLLFCSSAVYAQAPAWEWAKGFSCSSLVNGGLPADIASDAYGNIYITGSFNTSITIGNTTITNNGTYNVFVAKFGADGTLKWLKSSNTVSAYVMARAMTIDAQGNFYLTGHYHGAGGALFFGAGMPTPFGDNDVFVAKLDSNCTPLWVVAGGGVHDDWIFSGLSVDHEMNVSVTGSFTGAAIFGNDTLTNATQFDKSIFILKCDSNGAIQWVKKAGGTYNDEGDGVASDADGDLYVSGWFFHSANFGPYSLSSPLASNIFLARYDVLGDVVWARNVASTGNNTLGFSVAVDKDKNIYQTGTFSGKAYFDADTLIATQFNGDLFLAKYDSNGNVLWARGLGDAQNNYGHVSMDAGGDVCVMTGKGISKYDPSGNLVWAATATFSSQASIYADANNDVYSLGEYANFGLFGSNTLLNSGQSNLFLAKLSTHTGISESLSYDTDLSIYPNPSTGTFTIDLKNNSYTTLTVLNQLGQVVYTRSMSVQQGRQEVELDGLSNGVYFVRLSGKDKIATGKLVIAK